MAQNLNAPPSGQGSAGITAGVTGSETQVDTSDCEATTTTYVPAAPGSGVLTSAGVSSTQTDGLDEAN